MKLTGLIWAGLSVQDLERAVEFYQDVVGFRLRRSSAGWAVFDAGGGAMFELVPGGKMSLAPKTAEQQAVVVGFGVDDLPGRIQELQARGVNFIGEMEAYKSSRWIKLVDPEGNVLELKEEL